MTPDNIVEDASRKKNEKQKQKKNKQHQQKKIFWKAQGSKLNVTEIF